LPEGRTLVVCPTFNEADTIRELIDRLFARDEGSVELLVVDDASADGTARAATAAAGAAPVHLLERPSKLGLGSAYVDGFRWGIARGYDVLVEMDGDLSHDPGAVDSLVGALRRGADVAIGSRYVPGGSIRNWGRARRLLSAAGNLYARKLLRFPVWDATSGFRAYRAETLEVIDYATVRSEGYAFQIELTRRSHRAGLHIVEVPITFVERTSGQSKLSRAIVLEALLKVTAWGASDLWGHALSRRKQ
jgi:dolichol-phosphate mannosyltransferase